MFSNNKLKKYLNHYYKLLQNSILAYYIRCKAIFANFNHNQETHELWTIHSRIKQKFEENDITIPPKDFEKYEGNSFLDFIKFH